MRFQEFIAAHIANAEDLIVTKDGEENQPADIPYMTRFKRKNGSTCLFGRSYRSMEDAFENLCDKYFALKNAKSPEEIVMLSQLKGGVNPEDFEGDGFDEFEEW